MSMPPVSSMNGLSPLSQLAPSGSQAAGGTVPFESLVKDLLAQTSQEQSSMEDGLNQLAQGQADNIQEIVLSASRADLAFRLVMEIRNRLVSSYQEVMRMQV